MAEIRNQTLTGDQLIDGNSYVDCQFDNCRLVFEGGLPPSFNNCAFANTDFVLQEAAGRTIAFLRSMSARTTGMRHIVAGLLPELEVRD